MQPPNTLYHNLHQIGEPIQMETKLYTDQDIKNGVKNAFAAVLNRNTTPVYDGRFITLKHSFNSLNMTETEKLRVLFACEEQFGINLPNSAKQSCTVKSVIDAVTKAIKSAKLYEATQEAVAES